MIVERACAQGDEDAQKNPISFRKPMRGDRLLAKGRAWLVDTESARIRRVLKRYTSRRTVRKPLPGRFQNIISLVPRLVSCRKADAT
ncbi:MAG: hypothetical protein AB1810_09875 [Pseudomonadota bacterium]